MGHAEIVELALGRFSLGRALVAGQIAPVPVALGALRFFSTALTRFDANGIKKVGTQRSNPDIGIDKK